MKQRARKVNRFVIVFLTLILMLFGANVSAQNRRPTNATNVVAAFGFECQTTQFPRTKLRKAIRAAVAQVNNEGSSGNGERAVGYDLDGDGVKEYFVALRGWA